MTIKKTTKRALLSSVLSLFLCFAMLLGTTYAWFTDSVTSGSNVIKSGNLDIEVQYTLDGENWDDLDGANDIFQKGLWEPGHTEVVALKITNAGSLALKYNANMNIINEVIGTNKEGGDIVLSDILTVTTVTQQVNVIGDILLGLVFGGSNNTDTNSTDAFKNSNILGSDQELLAGEAHYLIVTVCMPSTVGNEANFVGAENAPSIDFGINVFATQYTYENDSFGNQYDKDAEYDNWDTLADISWYNTEDSEFTITNVNQLAGLAKLVNAGVDSFAGKTFALTSDVNLDNMNWNPIGTSSYPFKGTFNGNGSTVYNLSIESNNSYSGLFGYVAVGASISDITVTNVNIIDNVADNNNTCYGAVVGYCPGAVTLDNVNVTGNVQIAGEWYVGGIIGRSKGATITNCTVDAANGSVIESDSWVAGIVGYDNGVVNISGCTVENVTVKANIYAGGIGGLGAVNAKYNGNTVKNVNIVLDNADESAEQTYGTVIGGVSVYSYSTAPVYVSNNTVENVTCTVNGDEVTAQQIGSKYADGTDQGLIMMPTIKVGNGYYTYMKKAIEKAAKDGTEYVIELTGDTMVTAKFKPTVAKGQNIVIKTNGYKLLWVANAPVYDENGVLVTTDITAENASSYFSIKAGGTLVIE